MTPYTVTIDYIRAGRFIKYVDDSGRKKYLPTSLFFQCSFFFLRALFSAWMKEPLASEPSR